MHYVLKIIDYNSIQHLFQPVGSRSWRLDGRIIHHFSYPAVTLLQEYFRISIYNGKLLNICSDCFRWKTRLHLQILEGKHVVAESSEKYPYDAFGTDCGIFLLGYFVCVA